MDRALAFRLVARVCPFTSPSDLQSVFTNAALLMETHFELRVKFSQLQPPAMPDNRRLIRLRSVD
ncbi:hypothetical protein ACYULU_11460 [Breznakiellaceae bacterium SP9]